MQATRWMGRTALVATIAILVATVGYAEPQRRGEREGSPTGTVITPGLLPGSGTLGGANWAVFGSGPIGDVGQFHAGQVKGNNWRIFNPGPLDMVTCMIVYEYDGNLDSGVFGGDGCRCRLLNAHGRSAGSSDSGDFYHVAEDGADNHQAHFELLTVPASNGTVSTNGSIGVYALGRHAVPASALPPHIFELPGDDAQALEVSNCIKTQLAALSQPTWLFWQFGIK